jgi:hypothetical protein
LEMCFVKVIYHVCYPGITIKFLNVSSHDLISHTTSFSMVGPLCIVFRKTILSKMLKHVTLCMPTHVSAFATRTPDGRFPRSLPFKLFKCFSHESLGVRNPFRCQTTPTCPLVVHPVTITHSLSDQEVI